MMPASGFRGGFADKIMESEVWGMRDRTGPDCNSCEHFYVTWDAAFPYGCKGFQMKSKHSPSSSVLQASGTTCMLFLRRKRSMCRRTAGRKA
jgi:hypothetical protein